MGLNVIESQLGKVHLSSENIAGVPLLLRIAPVSHVKHCYTFGVHVIHPTVID